jgi:hypothetical protein
MQALHGRKVRLRVVPMAPSGLLARFRRLPGFATGYGDDLAMAPSWADDLVSAVETRALWSRFGL